ncbi:MAG: hypothetical protein IPG17_13625 [Sandaracinaceae bacterium]|nr:hypothetical protein [Sandaracinaceae bacterium]
MKDQHKAGRSFGLRDGAFDEAAEGASEGAASLWRLPAPAPPRAPLLDAAALDAAAAKPPPLAESKRATPAPRPG